MQQNKGETINAASTGLAVQYSPEYKLQPEAGYLDRLVREAGGTYINTPEEVYKGKLKDIFGSTDLTPALLIAALLLFILDIAARRLNLPLSSALEKAAALRAKLLPERARPVKVKKMQYQGNEAQKEEKSVSRPEYKAERPAAGEAEVIKARPESENLDTSALLKKKKNRS
jgi:hypothetical protein